MYSRKPSHVSRNQNAVLWAVPLCGLVVALVLFVVFISQGVSITSSGETPTYTLESSEPFSGEVYFNTEFGGTVFSDMIVSLIDRATARVEVAVYSINHPRIHDALYRAADRGVSVTLFLSAARAPVHSILFSDVPDTVVRIDYDPPRGLMHHKFLIIDRELPGETLVFGSYNFTELQEQYDASFVLKTTDTHIISVFGREFDRLVRVATTDTSNIPDRASFAARIQYPEGELEIWFSPPAPFQIGMRDRIRGMIAGASERVRGMIWNITDTRVADSLVSTARAGSRVELLTDDSTAYMEHSAIPRLRSQKEQYGLATFEILTDAKRTRELPPDMGNEFNPFLHHHMLVVDDRSVLFGTNNWSANGFLYNTESAMISDIPYLVSSFVRAFEDNVARSR